MSSDFDEMLAVDESPEYYSNPPLLPQVEFLGSESQPDENLLPAHSLRPKDSGPKVSAVSLRPETPGITERAKDDAAVSSRPSRQVDYLSHDWKEEDIWSSWRYIISKRVEFANSARLENASWRSWMKTKRNLKTISPEELNWCVSLIYRIIPILSGIVLYIGLKTVIIPGSMDLCNATERMRGPRTQTLTV